MFTIIKNFWVSLDSAAVQCTFHVSSYLSHFGFLQHFKVSQVVVTHLKNVFMLNQLSNRAYTLD